MEGAGKEEDSPGRKGGHQGKGELGEHECKT
jgi:hypothetical protein